MRGDLHSVDITARYDAARDPRVFRVKIIIMIIIK
jgi:hypothetical protein